MRFAGEAHPTGSLDLTTCEVTFTGMRTLHEGWYLNDIEALAWPLDAGTQ